MGGDYGARHVCGLAHRLPLHPLPASAQRHPESIRQSQSTAAVASELRQQLLDGIYAGQPFRSLLRELGLTPNRVWGLTKTDETWSTALETALAAARRDDLKHGTNAAYVAGCVCKDCREHQRQRMANVNRGSS